MNCPPKRREVIHSIGLIVLLAVLLGANSVRAIPARLADSETARTLTPQRFFQDPTHSSTLQASAITINQVEVVGSTMLPPWVRRVGQALTVLNLSLAVSSNPVWAVPIVPNADGTDRPCQPHGRSV